MLATERFVEELGLMAQENGDSRISGRILGLLIVDGGELSLTQISERLKVSRASVSNNARQLARRGAVRLTSRPGDRQDYYQMVATANFDLLDEMANRFNRHAKIMEECVAAMRMEDAAAAGRAAEVQDFVERSATMLQEWAKSIRDGEATLKDKE